MRSCALSLFTLCLLFSTCLFAKTTKDIEVVLERVNNLGIKQTDRLVLSDKSLIYNNKTLHSKKALELAKEIITYQEKEKQTCPAGTYRLVKKSGTSETKIEGCAQGKDYAKLLEKLYALLAMTRSSQDAP